MDKKRLVFKTQLVFIRKTLKSPAYKLLAVHAVGPAAVVLTAMSDNLDQRGRGISIHLLFRLIPLT
jgi:hypothetical protein